MSIFSGFYKLSPKERAEKIREYASLDQDEADILAKEGALSIDTADRMSENVIGTTHLPLSVATNFRINGSEVVIPMAVEEPSVVAAACRAAKQTLPKGFNADADEPVMIGQIQITQVEDTAIALNNLDTNRKEIEKKACEFMKPHEKYGCGIHGIEWRTLETSSSAMIIMTFYINVGDAQGANMVNTVLEKISPFIMPLTGGVRRLRIVSNLADKRKVRASAVWKKEVVGKEVIAGVMEGYEFAAADIHRCATHNKGIMNGIDAVAVATGNDWRSVEAGAHSFASLGGYHPLTRYEVNEKGDLVGSIELPMAVATVGPAISGNPIARIALKILKPDNARDLAMAMACVGLANNFAALSALSGEGIQKGHMRLHARNIAIYAGASGDEADRLAKKLAELKDFSPETAKKLLDKMRSN
jgi:hydroxymethylglutaryl-CoA reductase